jgi:hypothetical protein
MTQITCPHGYPRRACSTDERSPCPVCGALEESPKQREGRLDDQHALEASKLDDALLAALDALLHFTELASREDFADRLSLQLLCNPRAGPLRRACSVRRQTEIYFANSDPENEDRELALETAIDVANAIKDTGEKYEAGWRERGRLGSFWKDARRHIRYGSPLFLLAPSEVKAEILREYLPGLTPQRAADVLASVLEQFGVVDKRTLVQAAPLEYLRRAEWAGFRDFLPLVQRVELCREGSPTWLLEETAQAVAGSNSELVFWDVIRTAVGYPSRLFDLAPFAVQLDCLKSHFETLPAEESLTIMLNAMRDSRFARELRNLLEMAPPAVLLDPRARPLRRLLSGAERVSLCEQHLTNAQLIRETVEDITNEKGHPVHLVRKMWQIASTHAEFGSVLYQLAPPDVQRNEVHRHFSLFFDAVRGATEIPQFDWEWNASGVVGGLTQSDRALAQSWAGQEGIEAEHQEARMLSARAAEKVGLAFYRQFALPVDDISITQLEGGTVEWKLFDLQAGRRQIDVKNARVPVNNPNTFLEHCVPRYKQNRGQDVQIAAVVSPWITRFQFDDTSSIRPDVVPFRFLGEADRNTAQQLQQAFADLSARASATITVAPVRDGSHFLPPWLFEYPEFIYERRNQCRQWLLCASEDQLPPLEALRLTGINPLPAFLGTRRPLPSSWFQPLSIWQRDFYERVRHHPQPVTLPVVFLHLLLHFLEVTRDASRHSDYCPDGYRKLLYPDPGDAITTAGVIDPLSIVDALIKALKILWDHRHVTRLHEFQSFRFRGEGILSGKRKGQSEEVRILAYCGGRVPEKKNCKCGHSPLLIGVEQLCAECHYLICPKCQSCRNGCPATAHRRIAEHQQNCGINNE